MTLCSLPVHIAHQEEKKKTNGSIRRARRSPLKKEMKGGRECGEVMTDGADMGAPGSESGDRERGGISGNGNAWICPSFGPEASGIRGAPVTFIRHGSNRKEACRAVGILCRQQFFGAGVQLIGRVRMLAELCFSSIHIFVGAY